MKLIEQLKLDIGYTEEDVITAIMKKTGIKKSDILEYKIVKEGLDARKKPDLYFVLNVAISVKASCINRLKAFKDVEIDETGLNYMSIDYKGKRPIIVGFGPSGMFAGLVLALSGLKPIIIEQGASVEDRKKDVELFWNERKLNEYSNVQFGEGGAGTFSDGKLNSNINNKYCKKVINEFILNGAPAEIFYKSKPHIGSDKLPKIVSNIRNKIIENGGEVLFSHKLVDIVVNDNHLKQVKIMNLKTKEVNVVDTDILVLAIGHSALDTFEMLNLHGLKIEQKPFAMGVRIEQSQDQVNMMQYGKLDNCLPSADYKIVEHLGNGRNVFSFCMCPGGEVVASSCENGTIVTNGMSYFARDMKNANSALLVNVEPKDFESEHPLAGFYYQRKYERLAFELGGGDYNAPCQRVDEFLGDKIMGDTLDTSYRPGLKMVDISKCLPKFISDSLRVAIPKINARLKNFAMPNNLLIAIESKSSCPARIVRNDMGVSSLKGLYPIGEGAGYAGGIMSSAQDGIKVAELIISIMDV